MLQSFLQKYSMQFLLLLSYATAENQYKKRKVKLKTQILCIIKLFLLTLHFIYGNSAF